MVLKEWRRLREDARKLQLSLSERDAQVNARTAATGEVASQSRLCTGESWSFQYVGFVISADLSG